MGWGGGMGVLMGVRRILLALMFAVAAPSLAHAETRLALVIGNSAYANASPLANPANDAKDVAEKLKALGFDVKLGLDLDKRGFDATLRDFSTALESADSALVFYAGHGLQIAGRNYLIPVDAKLERERDVEFESVSLDFVLKQMELDRDKKTNIVFLDACRNNPLTRNLARSMGTRSASIGSGLAETFAGVGTFISYSTQPGNVALDGAGRNSPFASALVAHMGAAGKSLTSMMIDVRKDVVASTGGKQVPWDHSALTGDFYFDPNAKPVETGATQDRIRQLESEVKARTEAANVAANATLIQLKQRVEQMRQETRRDQDKVFDIQRAQFDERDQLKSGSNFREIGRLQIGMVKRSKDIEDLNSEIAKIEKTLGVATSAPDQTRALTPAGSAAGDAAPAPVAAERTTPDAAAPPASSMPASPPATTASVTPASDAPANAASAKEPAVKARKPIQHRKPKRDADADWNRKPLGP